MKRRLESKRHPTIEWVVRRAWPRNGSYRYGASCNVTVHGRTLLFDEDFTVAWRDGRMVVEGRHVFDMRDFGLAPPRFFWLWMEPEIDVRLRVVARQVAAAAPAD